MEKENIPYFNALMMLHFLLFKRKVDPKSHSFYQKRLKSIARYSPYVNEYASKVFKSVLEYLEK